MNQIGTGDNYIQFRKGEKMWVKIEKAIPRSAKLFPVWILTKEGTGLAIMTDDEKYFVTVPGNKVYKAKEVGYWKMVEMSKEDEIEAMNLREEMEGSRANERI